MNNGKRPKEAATKVERSSGNIFADLGLPNPEELLARAKVIGKIHDIIRRERLSDTAAAKMMGIPVADVDTILRGDVEDRYSRKELRFFLSTMQKATINLSEKNGKAKKPSKIKR